MDIYIIGLIAVSTAVFIVSVLSAFLYYRKARSAWMRYLVLYLVLLFGIYSVRAAIFLADSFLGSAGGAVIALLQIVCLAVFSVSLYIFPVFIFLLKKQFFSLKTKLALLAFPGCVLIFGSISAIWELERLQMVMMNIINIYLLVILFFGFWKQRLIGSDDYRKNMLPLLYVTAFYHAWSLVSRLFKFQFILTQGGLFDIFSLSMYVIITGLFLIPVCLSLMKRNRVKAVNERRMLMDEFGITSLESVIIQAIEQGLGNQEIGRILGLPAPEIDGRVYEIYQKFGVKNRRQLIEVLKKHECD